MSRVETRIPPPARDLTTLGSLIWNSVLVLAGYWLGDRWDLVETYVGVLSKAVLVLVVLAVVAYVVVRVRSRGRRGHRGQGTRRGPRRRGTRSMTSITRR